MKKIDDLPVDIWSIIFKNLLVNDLLNCRLVNKKFKDFSDYTNGIFRLSITDYLSTNYRNCWHYNKELIEQEDKISFRSFQAIKSLALFNLDRNLKYLIIKCDRALKLNELSNLINLEFLKIDYHTLKIIDQSLNLKELKYFKIKSQKFENESFLIKLNTPKLEIFKTDSMNEINFESSPESITHLQTTKYENKLKIFKNLEFLELHYLGNQLDDFLFTFKNLKKLLINDKSFYGKLEDNLVNILNGKKKYNRDIDIYFKGLKVENINEFEEYNSSGNLLEYQIKNLDTLESSCRSIFRLTYNELTKNLDNIQNDLPSSFFDKFSNVIEIFIYECKDVSSFIWFLKNLKDLKILTIWNCDFDLNFYNNLPRTIRILFFKACKIINYDFILKFNRLTSFFTDHDIDLFDLALKSAFLNLKYLNCFRFSLKSNKILITRYNYKFNFQIEGVILIKKLDYNQLVELCNKIMKMKNAGIINWF